MIASLSMYERPETLNALDSLWSHVQENLKNNGIDAPMRLSRDGTTLKHWMDPNLVLGQTCGLPYRAGLHKHVQLVGTPDLRLNETEPGYYRSAIVVRADDDRALLRDFAGARVVCNGINSQSGYAALKAHWTQRDLAWTDAVIFSGGHRGSALSVATGSADIAALDALTWKLIERHDDFAKKLKVLEWTQPTPTLPFICANQFDVDTIFAALKDGIAALDEQQRTSIGFYDVIKIGSDAYHAIPTPPESQLTDPE